MNLPCLPKTQVSWRDEVARYAKLGINRHNLSQSLIRRLVRLQIGFRIIQKLT